MPSNIDKAFIENLQNFTDSLESIVELLQKQAEKGDAVNQMLSTMDGPKLASITAEILEISKRVDDNTKKILEEVKAARKQKESGMFDKIEGKDNKRKIVDGIQTVILIAGGVLAIGMAFKIIGKVDFLSVIALSLGMLAVSQAFAEIAKIKDLTIPKTMMVGLALITIAGAITISSIILQAFKPMSMMQMFSFVVVSTALGVGSYFIFKAVNQLKLKPSDVWKYLLLPIILPAIAGGIVLSSFVLQYMKPVGIMQAFSAILVGLALAAGAFAISLIMKALKGKGDSIDMKTIGLALLIIPGIALSIVTASFIFKLFQPLKDPFQILIGSLVMGLSIIAFLPAVFVLGKKMNLKEMAIGVLGVIMLSTAIALTSHILNLGIYDGQTPSIMWSLSVGLSMLAFLPAIYVLGKKMDLKEMSTGVLGVLMVSTAIMLSSHILNLGKYDGSKPSIMWALGVGLSLVVFSIPIWFIGKTMKINQLIMGSLGVIVIAAAIMATSWIISIGKYDKAPPIKWALGVGLSLLLFVPAVLILGIPALTPFILVGSLMTLVIAGAIMAVSHIVSLGNYEKFPPSDWVKGVGLSFILFVPALIIMGVPIVAALAVVGAVVSVVIAAAVVAVSHILNAGVYDKYPSSDWISGVGRSLIDFTKISGDMKILDIAKTLIFVKKLSEAIVETSFILNLGRYDKYPSEDWILGVGNSLTSFAKITESLSVGDIVKSKKFLPDLAQSMVDVAAILSSGNFVGGPSSDWASGLASLFAMVDKVPEKDKLKRLQDFIEVLKDFSKAADKLKDSGIDKLNRLTASVTIMSVIDDTKLSSVLRIIDTNKDKISNMIESSGPSRTENTRQVSKEVERTATSTDTSASDKQDKMLDKFDTVIKKFDELLEFVISDKGPNNTGKNDTTKS